MGNKRFDLSWYGMMTVDNAEQVVELLKTLLVGKRYTFVACNEFFGFRPEVWTSRALKNGTNSQPFSVWRDEQDKYAGFNVNDSYGVWGVSTRLKEDQYDPKFDNPYFAFEWHKVTITHRAASGSLIYWCIATEAEAEA